MTIAPIDRRYPTFTIGWRLRLARTQLGPTEDVAAFAERIGVSRGTVTNYELERVKPRTIVLREWARHTGVDLEWLRTGERPPVTPTPGGGETLLFAPRPVKRRWRPEQDSNLQPTD